MSRIEKTVFISYRRTNIGYALAIFQHLTTQGYDVFFDYNSIDSGDFGEIILNNIASRAHFVLLLTPSALERLNEDGDWLRKEIEYAIETKRNIIPVTMEQFNWSDTDKYLTGNLAPLKSYNALRAPADYFAEAMNRLCTRFLNTPLDAVIHPRNPVAQKAANKAKQQAQAEPVVQEKELTAQEWFEKGLALDDNSQQEIDCYTKAISLKPDFAEAYNNRGAARQANGDLTGAINDYDKAISLNPDYADAYNNRGLAREANGDLTGAIDDYNKAISLKPDYADAYNNRGNARIANGDLTGAIDDYNKAIELKPDYAEAYYNRGLARQANSDLTGAMDDYNKAISLNPDDAEAYYNRGNARKANGDLTGAIDDFNKAISLKPDYAKAYVNRGALYFNNHKDYHKAKADFAKAVQLDPNYELARKNLEAAKKQLGE